MLRKVFTEKEIEDFYDSGEFRLHQERNDFLLPQIVDFVRTRRWLNLNPEYQRRLVWDRQKKSLLIESLLMNVPIPPVFLFEYDLNRYETMDGQQRLNTIVDFYANRFKLSGLKKWYMLNGRTYDDCPPRIRSGLDRRRLSATILLAESSSSGSTGLDIRRTVFERLNTGGLNLNPQELRNCLFSGPFNDLLIQLAGERLFNELWDIPPYQDHLVSGHPSPTLRDNFYYRRMIDCEIVLRYFAFRKRSKLRGAVKTILDNCMKQHRDFSMDALAELNQLFLSRLQLSRDIFEPHTFRIPEENEKERLSVPLFDAVMVALDDFYSQRDKLIRNRRSIYRGLCSLLSEEENYQLIVGRPNTASAIRARQKVVRDLFRENI